MNKTGFHKFSLMQNDHEIRIKTKEVTQNDTHKNNDEEMMLE